MNQQHNRANAAEAARQTQFLEVVDRDEAERRFQQHLDLSPLGSESIPLELALGRVLAVDVSSKVDVSGFDRSNVDGFAVRSSDTFGAAEEAPRLVRLNDEVLAPGVQPQQSILPGTATQIATGGMLPRGGDAVVMVEDTDVIDSSNGPMLQILRSAAPGQYITYAGTDVAKGETVLRAAQLLTSREIGVLAAIGLAQATVYRKPKVAIISTGNEIVAPGAPRPMGAVYDSNLAILAAAVQELGGEPVPLGIISDDESRLAESLRDAMQYDVVVLSGGTSKGAGDLSYRAVRQLKNPGIVAHGVALKPGKPICLAVSEGKPVVILPGFPTSAIFTFHEFVAPVIRAFAGRSRQPTDTVQAKLPMRVNSERGRTEYLLVGLVQSKGGLAAYPMGKGSGSVTTFSCADGFITIDKQTEMLEAGSDVSVKLLGSGLEPVDLVVIGSHCVGLDIVLGEMHRRGFRTKVLSVGSLGGRAAAQRGECDVAGIHLLDPETQTYNRPFVTDQLEFVDGYRRLQTIVFRPGDSRFGGKPIEEAVSAALNDPGCTLANRNVGSGTRLLIDRLLDGAQPPGYSVQLKSHNAVAAAVSQNRADWGVAIDTVADMYALATIPLQAERFDFLVPKERLGRPAVRAFQALLQDAEVRGKLEAAGFPM